MADALALSPDQLRRLPTHVYQVAGVSQQRISTLRRNWSLVGAHRCLVCGIQGDFLTKIQHLPHMGPWTANHVLGVAMGEPDVVVTGDYSLPHTVAWALALESAGYRFSNDQIVAALLLETAGGWFDCSGR